jgi:hypothetical protein
VTRDAQIALERERACWRDRLHASVEGRERDQLTIARLLELKESTEAQLARSFEQREELIAASHVLVAALGKSERARNEAYEDAARVASDFARRSEFERWPDGAMLADEITAAIRGLQ